MTRAAFTVRCAYGLVLIAAWLVWRAPAVAIKLGALMAGRVRFRLAIWLGHALVAAECPGIASRVYAAEIRRNKRAAARLRGRPS